MPATAPSKACARPAPPLIRIDIDPEQLTRKPFADLPLLSDAAASLAGIAPYRRLMAVLDETLPGAAYVGDSTQTVYSANQFFRPRQPRSFFNASTGYGTLGYGLPAAIGAAIGVAPARPIVALVGDGAKRFDKAGTRLVSMGGDHGITGPLVKAVAGKHSRLTNGEKVALVHFDSHTASYNNLPHWLGNRRSAPIGRACAGLHYLRPGLA
ncbi:hypothetical protein M2281_004572 [Mesorhizobium soli]|uniref:thiamine pyrophosphate-dependent enzyme n=1 Tax=Pseudaminobacter soli (ex Li et al. 2025) TaxID=1295366 RepID=UPI002472EFF4|nr:thiamine pyrophosphate-dependent enzyme [Mesorhizobium soli]MDH6233959.1 hypothetical protein [Mesorhizobium soli]